MQREIHIEGYTTEEILTFSQEDVENMIFCDEPLLFTAGTASILGEFRKQQQHLVVELAQIDGGGEGILLTLWNLVARYAHAHEYTAVEWIVHAVNCASPNLKLKRMLEKRGFVLKDVEGSGNAYYFCHPLEKNDPRDDAASMS
jgi:hypothetical protein